jgi:hypothetical protein
LVAAFGGPENPSRAAAGDYRRFRPARKQDAHARAQPSARPEVRAEGGSEKHLRDIAGILRVSASRLDQAYIDEWVTRLELRPARDAGRRLAAEAS